MVNTRTPYNRIKIEHWRIPVGIDPAVTVYQGDAICFDVYTHLAIPAVSTSGAQFMGISDTTNPVETAGSPTFLSNQAYGFINVVQHGLVELIAGTSETMKPFDTVVIGADAQHVVKGSSNPIGVVDPKWATPSGKAVILGDMVRFWLRVPQAFNSLG